MALTVAFFVGSALGVAPAWIAVGGAAVVGVAAVARREATPDRARPGGGARVPPLRRWRWRWWSQAAVDHGLGDAARDVLPSGDGLLALLAMAAARPRCSPTW